MKNTLESNLPVVEDNAESTCLSPTTEHLLGGFMHQLFLLKSFLSLTFLSASLPPQRQVSLCPEQRGCAIVLPPIHSSKNIPATEPLSHFPTCSLLNCHKLQNYTATKLG